MKFTPQLIVAASTTLFTTAQAASKNPFATTHDATTAMGDAHAMRQLASLAKKVTNPDYLESLKTDIDLMEYDTSSFGKDLNGRRKLVSDDECGLYLAASLAQDVWNCFDLASELMSLVTEVNCVDVYDFSDRKIDSICSNECHNTLTEVFKTMSQAGCSGAILKQGCSECSDNEVCVDDSCRPYCVTDDDCSCDDVCSFGACTNPSSTDVDKTDLGINGYKITLEYICSAADAPSTVAKGEEPDYCFSSMYNLLNDVDANSFCDDMEGLGCCVGSVFDYMTNCATTSDSITTDAGTISLADLEGFCPNVNFRTACVSAPVIEEDACAEGYFLESSAGTHTFSIMASIIVLFGLVVSI